MIKSFFAALSFISRLPVPARLSQGLEIEQYQRSIVTFPLVGLLLGAIAGAVVMLLQPWCASTPSSAASGPPHHGWSSITTAPAIAPSSRPTKGKVTILR